VNKQRLQQQNSFNHQNRRNTEDDTDMESDMEGNNKKDPETSSNSSSFIGMPLGKFTRSLGSDTARAYRTMESALANLTIRLRDNQGRNTPGVGMQLLLFIDRQV
jgi:hypothetical protein